MSITTKTEVVIEFNQICDLAKRLFGYDIRKEGWKISFNSRKSAVGLCNYTRKTIYISTHFMSQNDIKTIKNTISHEIAHAYTPGNGHNKVWKDAHKRLGGNGERCAGDEMKTSYKYHVIDTRTNKVIGGYNRMPRRDISKSMIANDRDSLGKLKLVKV